MDARLRPRSARRTQWEDLQGRWRRQPQTEGKARPQRLTEGSGRPPDGSAMGLAALPAHQVQDSRIGCGTTANSLGIDAATRLCQLYPNNIEYC